MAISSKVKIVLTSDDQIVTPSLNNPEYGYIQVEQSLFDFNPQGFVVPRRRVAMIIGKLIHLDLLRLTPDYEFSGKIVVEETLTPSDPNDSMKNIKRAFAMGPICRVDDSPIYRRSYYTEDIYKEDILIPHTNGDEIKRAIQQNQLLNQSLEE